MRAVVSGRHVVPQEALEPPAAVTRWVRRFEAHKRAVMAAVAEPSAARVRNALVLDPLVPPDRVEAAAALLDNELVAAGGDLRRLGLS